MDIVIGLAAVALAIWLFLRANTNRGIRTVRAFIYLRAIQNGKSKDEAHEEAREIENPAPKRLIHDTMLHLQKNYQGRDKNLIKEARAAGFIL